MAMPGLEISATDRQVFLTLIKPTIAQLLVNFGLWGMTIVMTAAYFISGSKGDRWPTKALVAAMMLIASLNVIGNTHGTWMLGVVHAMDMAYLVEYDWGFKLQNSTAFVVCTLAQSFYVERCYRLSRNIPVLAVSILFVLGNLGAGLGQLIFRLNGSGIGSPQQGDQLALAYLWTTVGAEIWICGAFVYFVLKARQGFNELTDRMLMGIIKIALEGSLLTVLVAMTSALIFSAARGSNLWIPFFTQIPLTYFLSVLYSLNIRSAIRAAAEQDSRNAAGGATGFGITSKGSRRFGLNSVGATTHTVGLSVLVETETARHHDKEDEVMQEKLRRISYS